MFTSYVSEKWVVNVLTHVGAEGEKKEHDQKVLKNVVWVNKVI
jgi:hypothetical protein